MGHDDVLRKNFGVSQRTVVDRIMRVYARASEDDVLEGKAWYADAQGLARELAELANVSVERSAIVIAHLSANNGWASNKVVARQILVDGRNGGHTKKVMAKVHQALADGNPWSSFSATSHKTRSFALNIIGDADAVTVDRWACRIAGVDQDKLGNVGAYEAVAHCYRLAARRAGISPSAMQAVTWVVERGSAA